MQSENLDRSEVGRGTDFRRKLGRCRRERGRQMVCSSTGVPQIQLSKGIFERQQGNAGLLLLRMQYGTRVNRRGGRCAERGLFIRRGCCRGA